MFEGETFAVFHSVTNVFPQIIIMAFSIGNVHVSLQACYRQSFPVNNNIIFHSKMRKFSPSNVLPYTACTYLICSVFTKSLNLLHC